MDLKRSNKQEESRGELSLSGPTPEDIKAAGEMSSQEREEFIKSMVQRLADRLKRNPKDKNGWLRLARAYDVLGEREKARQARNNAELLSR